MAAITLLSWNIEVFGPEKYGNRPNNAGLVRLVAAAAADAGANIIVLMELSTSVADQIVFSIGQAMELATNATWTGIAVPARPGGDRESYGILWQTAGVSFNIVALANGQAAIGLSALEFPNNVSDWNGRRAAWATFRTADTNNNFTVTVYHAPPNARAIQGLEALAKTDNLYVVDNQFPVPFRLLAGDYNLDAQVQPEYTWLTDPVPIPPPPAVPGEGAGTAVGTFALTSLWSWPQVGPWPQNSLVYRNWQLDNIFYAVPGGPVFVTVYDLVARLMNPRSMVRRIANNFTLTDGNLRPAFPNANQMAAPLRQNLNLAQYAWLLARYGVSDHLPVVAQVVI